MVKRRPLISAIIIVYKSEKYIGNCIKSLVDSARYAKIRIEIIVVINDKGNKDYGLKENTKTIRVIKAKYNLGYAKGLNEGVKLAKGEWLLFANPDTIDNAYRIL